MEATRNRTDMHMRFDLSDHPCDLITQFRKELRAGLYDFEQFVLACMNEPLRCVGHVTLHGNDPAHCDDDATYQSWTTRWIEFDKARSTCSVTRFYDGYPEDDSDWAISLLSKATQKELEANAPSRPLADECRGELDRRAMEKLLTILPASLNECIVFDGDKIVTRFCKTRSSRQ